MEDWVDDETMYINELEGIQIGWYPSPRQQLCTIKSDEPFLEVEATVFNHMAMDAALTRFVRTAEGVVIFDEVWIFEVASPVVEDVIEVHLEHLVAVRKMLKYPTREQGMELMRHPEQSVRDFALGEMADWREEWREQELGNAILDAASPSPSS